MDENGTPQEPGQAPPPPPEQPPAAPFGDPPAPETPAEPPAPAPAEPPATPPPAPPAQPPSAQGQYQPPPAQQPTPVAGQPVAAPPAKKKPSAIILIIVAVVLGLCALTACGIGAFMILGAGNVEDTIAEADAYYDSAIANVDEMDVVYSEALTAIENGDMGQSTTLSDEALLLALDARADVAESRVLNDSLDSSAYSSAYDESLAQLDLCIDSFEGLFTLLPQEGELYTSLDTWFADLSDADDKIDNCYTLIENDEYASAKTLAQEANDTYVAATAYFTELEAEFPGHELEKQVRVEELLADLSAELVAVADAGIKEDWGAYDDHVDSHDEIQETLDNTEWPSWNEDWTLLFSTDVLYDEAVQYYDASIDAWNLSADAYNAGDY